ncbi:MAG: hypothetical protein PVF17_11785 [Ignavibacteria bacterium]|jgi:hypothetical protein
MKIFTAVFILFTSHLLAQGQSVFSVLELEQNIKNTESQNTSYSTSLNKLSSEKKSAGIAILYSLLLPGMGELYAGNYSSGKYFTIAEGALWATFIGMNIYAGNKKDDYIAYATTNASINPEGKDESFFATIGEYSSFESYNDQKAFERNFDEMYRSEAYFWEWNSTEERRTYRGMWSSSEQTYNDLRFVVGAMILNRVISAINAVRLVSSYNKNLETEVSWNVSMGLENKINLPTSLNIYFSQQF